MSANLAAMAESDGGGKKLAGRGVKGLNLKGRLGRHLVLGEDQGMN